MRKFVLAVAAITFTGALAPTLARAGGGGVPPKAGQVDIGGEALKATEATPDFDEKNRVQRTAFEDARKIADPAKRAEAFKYFLRSYPDSVARRNAQLQVVTAYAEALDPTNLMAAAQVVINEHNTDMEVLSVVVDCQRRTAARLKDPDAALRLARTAAANGQLGLNYLASWRQPDAMADRTYKAIRSEGAAIFERALGYAALKDRDFPAARVHYLKALSQSPDNWPILEDLAAADLLAQPVNPEGFWYAPRAASLARAARDETGAVAIERFARGAYRRYHGGEEGWGEILAAAARETAPPQGFAARIAHAPSPAELAVQAVAQNDVRKLGFGDWEAILSFRDASPANRAAADKVWAAIEDLQEHGAAHLKLPVKVISATATTIEAAITDDARASNTPDLHVTLAQPLAAPLKPGDQVEVSGVLVDYTPQPFAFRMARGRL
jgi:hypothetical protein